MTTEKSTTVFEDKFTWPEFWLGIVTVLPMWALQGFVASQLWKWFMVPIGLPLLGIWQALGILLVTRYFTGTFKLFNKDERPILRILYEGVLRALFFLAMGYVIQLLLHF